METVHYNLSNFVVTDQMPDMNDFMGKSECTAVNGFPPMGPEEVEDVPRIDRFKCTIHTCSDTIVIKVTVAGIILLMSETSIGQSMNVQIWRKKILFNADLECIHK